MRIAFSTLGCKINQFETDVMRREFENRGDTIVPFGEEADVYVINTCSVTAKSDYQSRQVIRSAVRRGDGAKVVVTGCYAETQPDEIRKISGVDLVCGNGDKAALFDRIVSTVNTSESQGKPSDKVIPLKIAYRRTRGVLKIQDGCDNRCSYCIVPTARGSSRSVSPEAVQREFEALVRAGCPEVVLSGIHIGTYGKDLRQGITLTGMVKSLLAVREGTRLRLSSIEPGEITDDLIAFLGKGLCRHLHIPLQSGDDAVLASMKRNYTSGSYMNLLERISKQVPGVALGTDVMVGYPGEGEAEFQNTYRLIEESPLTHLHVFSYSPRPGTPAAAMKNQVPATVKKQRSEALRRLGERKNLKFREKFIGAELHVVIEGDETVESVYISGISDNYLRVIVLDGKRGLIGRQVKVSVKGVDHSSVLAETL